jgi:tRNA 2-thiouridine synthesizing protein E
MPNFNVGDKAYEVDDFGFLVDFEQWDEDFTRAMAAAQDIPSGLSDAHWKVIRYIHGVFLEEGRCPLVFQTCRANGLRLKQLAALFPAGYMRGACKLAGISYRAGYHGYGCVPPSSRQYGVHEVRSPEKLPSKTYTIDVRGFLVNPDAWDEPYATMRAADMKMPALTQAHWDILRQVRSHFQATGAVPTVYETCDAAQMEAEDLEALFPDGYHRGVIKLAGLRLL